MEITYKANSAQDFANRLKEVISHLDDSIFKKPGIVSISNDERYKNSGTAAFSSKRPIFHWLGMRDNYFIFAKSKNLEKSINFEFMATSVAAHEVRHRFQYYNKNVLITYDFLKQKKYIPGKVLEHIYFENYNLYGKNKTDFDMEFDASIIEAIVDLGYQHPNFTMDTVIKLIQCSEDTIGDVLSKIVRPI
jgi:hypothetical protein